MNQQSDTPGGNHTTTLNEARADYRTDPSSSEYPLQTAEDQGWIDFRDQCRRQMQRSMEQRLKYGFCRIYKPVLDDASWRVFNTTAEYRAWCEANLPAYLGFRRPAK